jgi:D-erythronate 2-dehydrogenase
MRVLVTGAAGFLGARLVEALLSAPADLPAIDHITAADLERCPLRDARVEALAGSLEDDGFVRAIVTPGVDLIFHLAAVLSGQAEAEFDAGLRVNVDATRALLDACRGLRKPPRFVFASTVAVFGGALPPIVPEDLALRPETSYGTEKAIAELLVGEYTRRGFIDGISCRLPTVAVRPGRPNAALSSFVSGIIREPLAGLDSVCPVPLDTPLWIASPASVTHNLVHAARIPSAALAHQRALNVPGISVTPADMLDSLERAAGAEVRSRVRCEPDDRVMPVVSRWPAALDVTRALSLGFEQDVDFDDVLRQFIEERRQD